jgi:exoribonuclease R
VSACAPPRGAALLRPQVSSEAAPAQGLQQHLAPLLKTTACARRVFSIDPPTAKDLDDALSVEALPGGGLRVGVHIADVAHFIPPGSALDRAARERGTSTYLARPWGAFQWS